MIFFYPPHNDDKKYFTRLDYFLYNFSTCKNKKNRLVRLKNILPDTKTNIFIKLLNY